MQKFQCRWAPSLGELEATHQEAWGTREYKNIIDPTVFFGLFDLRDYIALAWHMGRKYVLWAGSDLRNLEERFIFNDGKLKFLSKMFRGNKWVIPILRKAKHYVENQDEADKLARFGLKSTIVPSFLGNIHEFPLSYKQAYRPKVYISGHPHREDEYGFNFIQGIADAVPECIFHLYGVEWKSERKNIVCHGWVPKDRMNEEIKGMQCGLRLNDSDGFSEITAKSILMGQYPITKLQYPMIPNFDNAAELVTLLKSLRTMNEPNFTKSAKWW